MEPDGIEVDYVLHSVLQGEDKYHKVVDTSTEEDATTLDSEMPHKTNVSAGCGHVFKPSVPYEDGEVAAEHMRGEPPEDGETTARRCKGCYDE